MSVPIPLSEEFNSPKGVIWDNYDSYVNQNEMASIKQVTIRNFGQIDDPIPSTMLYLSTQTMDELEVLTMDELELFTFVERWENWQNSTCVREGYGNTLVIEADDSSPVEAFSIIQDSSSSLEAINLYQSVGSVLICSNGKWSEDLDKSDFSYQWFRDGVEIPDAVDNTYTITWADQRTDISCTVTARKEDRYGTASTDGVTSVDGGLIVAIYPETSGYSGFDDDDHIILSIPEWSNTVDLITSQLELTSNETGDFDVGPTASVAFNTSQIIPVDGDPSELRFLRSQFNQNNIDLSSITGVKITLVSTSVVPEEYVFAGGIRLISKDWQYSGLEIETRLGRLQKSLPRDADLTATPEFTWPILWRSSDPPGVNDPRPIDSEFGVEFFTGDIGDTNSISLYFREVTADFLTQLDINGMKQSQLNGYDQPDIGTAKYNSRTMDDLGEFIQDELLSESQFSLERTPDYLSASWIQILFQWESDGSGSITFNNTEDLGYILNIPENLEDNTRYTLRVSCKENSVSAWIYKLSSIGEIVTKIFDSNIIFDTFQFKRRAGRFGWHANLQDGTTWVDGIRERYSNFAEYRSLPLRSFTPVDGAELFKGSSPNIEKFTDVLPGKYNTSRTSINRDTEKSKSGLSWKVVSTANEPLQGFQTNNFSINDWANSRAEFDIYISDNQLGDIPQPKAFLFDAKGLRGIELILPNITPGQWQHISIDFPYEEIIVDEYNLAILQPEFYTYPWWVDNITVFSRSVVWEGRSVADDPWGSNNAQWVPFHENYNRENGGILFTQRGTELQVRAKALRQYAEINRVQFKPKYSQLGRFPEIEPIDENDYYFNSGKPTEGTIATGWTVTDSGMTQNFSGFGSSSYAPGAFISQFVWNFGDGDIGFGENIDHTYRESGTYIVTLTVVDNFGYQGVYSDGVTVS